MRDGYNVPAKVIAYLQTTKPYLMSPGIYEHPFIKGKRLLGPYMFTDGYYWWDRDTWKYVVKYNVTLVFIWRIRFLFNNDFRVRSHKVFVVKRNVANDSKAICYNGKFKDIAEVTINV